MQYFSFASYLPMLAAIKASEQTFFRLFADDRGPSTYRRSPSAAKPESYRRHSISRTGRAEAERHLRQMTAGQLDFSASNPSIWRNRPYAPNVRSLLKRSRHVH